MPRYSCWVVSLAAILCGCRHSSEVGRTYPHPKPDPWVLSCLDPTNPTPAVLWNGLVGVRIGRDGTGLGPPQPDGVRQELPFFMVSEYEKGGEEKIIPLANPLVASWLINGNSLDPKDGADYAQVLDMRTGLLTTSWTQEFGNVKLAVKCEDAICPDDRVIAQKWTLTGMPRALIEFRSAFKAGPGASQPVLTDSGHGEAYYALSPAGAKSRLKHAVTGTGEGTWQTADGGLVWRGESKDGQTISMERVVELPPLLLHAGPLNDAMPVVWWFDNVRDRSQEIWAKRWKTDIEIDGPVEDQQAVRSFLFYLRSAINPKAGMAISPMGLSSATYNGHVFWDADTWVFPALALVDPAEARAIPDYRLRMFGSHLPKREDGVGGEGYAAGRHLSPLPPSPASKGGGPSAPASKGWGPSAPFPWESSITGQEVAPPAMRNEIHVDGDVAWMLNQAAALGLADPHKAKKVKDAVAGYYLGRATKTHATQPITFELKGVTSPDESHTGDNDLYTNLLADWACGFASFNINIGFKRPHDSQGYLTYDGDALRTYKQAAAVLAIYPLQMVDDKQARVMMDRFADKVTANGPAMSGSVHALIWARLGESQKAYDAWRKSWMDYTDHPLLLFSEKPKKEVTYFTTGASGCLQTVIFGFLGFRIDYRQDKMAAWSNALNGWSNLTVKPALPAAWRSVRFKNFTVRGKRYTLTVDAHGVKVTQGES